MAKKTKLNRNKHNLGNLETSNNRKSKNRTSNNKLAKPKRKRCTLEKILENSSSKVEINGHNLPSVSMLKERPSKSRKGKSSQSIDAEELILNKNIERRSGKRCNKISAKQEDMKGKSIETQEKLVIKLVKLDKSVLSTNTTSTLDLSNDDIKPKHFGPTKKVCKSDIQKHHLLNVNKTESMKIEEMLLKKHQGMKQKTVSNEDESFKPYVYQKTNKPVYETYKIVRSSSGEKALCCLLCPFTAERFHPMSLHHKFKHRDTPIEEMHFCDVKDCKFMTVHQGIFKWHMRRHALASDKLPLEQFSCDQCCKVFNQRKGYLIHLKHMHKEPLLSASEQTVFPCATCNFKTNIQRNLQMHIYRCHVPDEQRTIYNCDDCSFETYYKISLKRHLDQVHHNANL